MRAVRLVLERRDHRLRAAVDCDELRVLGNALAEARAAVAEDAALAVERDERGDRDRLVEGPLREGHTGVAGPVAEGEVLQRAGRLRLRRARRDLAEAHAARADGRPETGLVAEDRDLDAGGERRLDQARALGHLDLDPVDRQLDD